MDYGTFINKIVADAIPSGPVRERRSNLFYQSLYHITRLIRTTMKYSYLASLCCYFLVFTSVTAKLQYTGVNLAGPVGDSSQWAWATQLEMDYFVARGMNYFRVPLQWETMQPTLQGPLDPTQLGYLTNVVNYLTLTKNVHVHLDVHNYARYNGNIIGAPGSNVTVADFQDLWTRLANVFKNNSLVFFALMNEPHDMSTNLWLSDANAAIQAIRATGATNKIIVSGNGWDGAYCWLQNWYDTSYPQVSNAVAMLNISDPLNNFVFEVHQYFDSDGSGTHDTCLPPPIGSQPFVAVTGWMRQYNYKVLLTEFGGGYYDPNCSRQAIQDCLDYLDANNDVWLGWTFYAGGPRLGADFLGMDPRGYPPIDHPNMDLLVQHAAGTLTQINFPTNVPTTCVNGTVQTVFDTQFENGWQDWSWGTHTVNSSMISFVPANYDALYFAYLGGISTAGFTALQFSIAGDPPGYQYINVEFRDTSSSELGTVQGAGLNLAVGDAITTQFIDVFIPLAALDLQNVSTVGGFLIRDAYPGTQQPTVYVKDVKLLCTTIQGGPGSTSAAPAPPYSSSTPSSSGTLSPSSPSSSPMPASSSSPSIQPFPSTSVSKPPLVVITAGAEPLCLIPFYTISMGICFLSVVFL